MNRPSTVEVPGANLACQVVGAGRPLLILHGGPGLGCGYLRSDLVRLLASRYALVFYDQRASGHSSGAADPGRITMPVFVEDLDAVRRACGLARINLLGHSFGGLLAMHYAIAHPARVEALVLVESDPASYAGWLPFRRIIEERQTPEERAELARVRSREDWERSPAALRKYYEILLRSYFGRPEAAARLDLGLDEQVAANLAQTGTRMRESLGAWDIHEDSSRIRARTLLIYGGRSIYPRDAVEATRASIPGSSLVVLDGAGHFPWLEAPDQFVAALREI